MLQPLLPAEPGHDADKASRLQTTPHTCRVALGDVLSHDAAVSKAIGKDVASVHWAESYRPPLAILTPSLRPTR
jgi:hypothetical protein